MKKKTINIMFNCKPVLTKQELTSLLKCNLFCAKYFNNVTFMYQSCLLFMQKPKLSAITN